MEWLPLAPFEPISATQIPTGEQWIAQIKWDGVRMLTYFDGQEVRLFNRRLNERTMQYPELSQPSTFCRSSSFIIDGELIAFDENKPSFHEIMKRDSLRRLDHIERAVKRTPVVYMIFDVLYIEGKSVMDKPLLERQALLNEYIIPHDNIQVVQNFSDASQLLKVMKAHQMEGIVCKNTESTYSVAGKDKRWQKIKIFYDLHAIVGGITLNHDTVNSMLLGLYNATGEFVYIGHSGPGKLAGMELQNLTNQAKAAIIPEMPFMNKPERYKDVLWVNPQIIVKIQYMEWTTHGTMRHPTVQAIVTAVHLEDCTFKQLD
ncbi:ATP-dependent DNA ligase [Cohnella abietis]|uniref:DNA ligase (ATP) n=1 Tax=Cohnella abietis TaxID=2507935 RepID=A0A3T1D147_9BACL|nr:RNA ligase family protein [Cohnella abietis]BBI31816.1 DNA ligase [Cohnella abietis]